MLKKIVVIGPESTGKSTLCELLAQHYNTLWYPEFAREYLSIHGTKYTYDDLLTIAKGQVELEERFESLLISQKSKLLKPERENDLLLTAHHTRLTTHDSLLFIDTDM